MLAYFVLTSLLVCVAAFIIARWTNIPIRWIAGAQVSLVAIVLAFALITFLGHSRDGSPRLDAGKALRFLHIGYYGSAEGTFRFGVSADPGVIPHAIFHPSEYLLVWPLAESGSLPRWGVESNANRLALRIDGKCINVMAGNWLEPNQSLRIVRHRAGRLETLQISYRRANRRLGAITLPDWFGQRESFEMQWADGANWNAAVENFSAIREARSVGALLASNAMQIRNRQWGLDQSWIDAASAVVLVREQSADLRSRLGLLINWDRLQAENFTIWLNGRPLIASRSAIRAELASGARISLGAGGSSFAVVTGKGVASVPELGQVVELDFASPSSFSLPPDWTRSFLITSSTDFVPMNGFRFPLGGRANTFYVKGKIDPGNFNLVVNDGVRQARYRAMATASAHLTSEAASVIPLGSRTLGVLVALRQPGISLPYPGLIAAAAVVFLSLLVVLEGLAGMVRDDGITDVLWSNLWCFLLTLLSVRVILAYRAALLPPSDASPGETGVFLEAAVVSITGLWVLPACVFIARFVCWRLNSPGLLLAYAANGVDALIARLRDSLGGVRLLAWLAPAAIYILLAKLFGANESLGMRINMVIHLLAVIPFAFIAGNLDRYTPRERLMLALSLPVPSLLAMFVIRDFGSIVYFLGMAVTAILVWFQGRRRGTAAWIAAAVFISAPWLFGALSGAYFPGLRPLIYPALPDTAFYRVITETGTEEEALQQQAGDGLSLDIDKLLRNSQQAWQMLTYVSRGSAHPAGFGGAPLTKVAMTYPTSMADCAYAIFLTSEHGAWAAVLVIVVFIALGATCFAGGLYLPSPHDHRTFPLAMIGIFFALQAVYMASANVGILPFTGQNIPMLALYSRGDLAQAGVLLVTATFLFFYDVPGVSRRRETGLSAVGLTGAALFFGFLIWTGNIFWHHRALAAAGSTEFGFSEALLHSLENDLPGADRNGPWQLDQSRLELIPAPGAKLSLIEMAYGRQFNERADKFSADAGLYYLERIPSQEPAGGIRYRMRVNENYVRLKDPFQASLIYGGSIYASDSSPGAGLEASEEPVVMALGQPFRVLLHGGGQAQTLILSAPLPKEVSNGVVVQAVEGGPRLFEVFRTGQDLFIEQQFEGSSISIDGQRLPRGKNRRLQPSDLIVCKIGHERYTLIYLGLQPRVLAYTQWMNGRTRRIFTPEGDTPEIWAIGGALDEATRLGRPLPPDFGLTIAPELQTSLDDAISKIARNDPLWKNEEEDPAASKRIAVSVIDAYSGDLLADAAWPRFSPSNPRFDEYSRSPDWRRQQSTRDPALIAHSVGSTVKPLVFAAVASQLWPERDLAKMIAYNRGIAGSSGAHIHQSIGCIKLRSSWDCETARADCDARTFLIDSVNFYQATIGFMGLWLSKRDWNTSLIANRSAADLSYDGTPYKLDLNRVAESPLTLGDAIPQPRTDSMKRALLFQGLSKLFDASMEDDASEALNAEIRQFLPSLAPHTATATPGSALLLAVPEPARLMPENFQDLRGDYISYLLGGSRCQWSNIKMAESYARLATGIKVVGHIESSVQPESEEMPAPISSAAWRTRNLVEPMQMVSEEGTAVRLRGLVSAPLAAMYKTGTVNDNDEWESEFLAFVVGQYNGRAFIRGRSVAGFIWLERSKRIRDKSGMKKFEVGKAVVKAVSSYLSGN